MTRLEYYKEALDSSLDECNASNALTEEQKLLIAENFMMAKEMESEAFGDLSIPNPLQTELDSMKRKHKEEVAQEEKIGNIYRKALANRMRVEARHLYIQDGQVCIGR